MDNSDNSFKKIMQFFDRQERIIWWSQERLFNARILVVGAGALGNEVLKNLALLGVGCIYVVDFDIIEDSNISRAVLFRVSDAIEGAKKATIAAERAKTLNPNPNAVVIPIHGNVVWDIGSGLYRHIDLALGCLDNLEARLAVNLNCWRAKIPWIDGGLWEFSGSVDVYDSSQERACYECGMTPDHYRQTKQRYSCTNQTVKTRLQEGYAPTTQTVSSVIAALQCQEAIKLLHGLPSFPGKRLVFNGDSHFYSNSEFTPVSIREMPVNPDCLCHGEERLDVLELPAVQAKNTTIRQLIKMVEELLQIPIESVNLGRDFVTQAICDQCGGAREINRPLYLTRDIDVVCLHCEVECPSCHKINIGVPDCPNCGQVDISEPRLNKFHTISINDLLNQIYLDYKLFDLGIPLLHILELKTSQGESLWVELTGDLANLSSNTITQTE
jgi:adenylyltransferase/sulfurtransferase